MLIVGIHEWGHFSAAKMFGVKVFEFGLGIPPRLRSLFTDKSGTEYTLNWLPLWGFVRLKGDAYEDELKDDDDALFNKPIWQQIIVMLAGIFMNFLGAGVLLAIVFMLGTRPIVIQIQDENAHGILSKLEFQSLLIPQYADIEEAESSWAIHVADGVVLDPVVDGIAYQAGVMSGDQLLGINGARTNSPQDLVDYLQSLEPGANAQLAIIRDSQLWKIDAIPEDAKLWVYVRPNYIISEIKYWAWQALENGFVEAKNQAVLTFKVLGYMLSTWIQSDDSEARKEVAEWIWGPVAVGNIFVSMAQNGLVVTNLLIFAALISISLWVFNLLPIPALDGGRVLVLLINGASRTVLKKDLITWETERQIHGIGFVLLMIIAVLVAYKDVLRIFG